MRNCNELNSKLQYETFIYEFNHYLSNNSHLYNANSLNIFFDELELNDLFYYDFKKYINKIIKTLMINNYLIPNKLGDILREFLIDNFDDIDFDDIPKTAASCSFFTRYILKIDLFVNDSNFNMFLYSIKYIRYGEQVLDSYMNTFIKYKMLNENQLNKLFMFIAAYQTDLDIKPKFISKYIKYFSTPKIAYVLKTNYKSFYNCSDAIINKLTKLANEHIYGKEDKINGK